MSWISWEKLCRVKTRGGLNFTNLRAFNLALLAKQCWRIMEKPESLIAQVFRARHFSSGYFMEASVGSRPSATWHSILHARAYFERGLRVRIGNGYGTPIWGSAWIPDAGNFRIITPSPISYFPLRVSDLIDPVSGRWNEELINNTFWEVDRGHILAIPLGTIEVDDKVIWHYSKDGRFSVRTCYHIISSLSSGNGGESTSGVETVRWHDIWSLPIPPKVRMFLWRACVGILPHKAELFDVIWWSARCAIDVGLMWKR